MTFWQSAAALAAGLVSFFFMAIVIASARVCGAISREEERREHS